MSERKTRYSWRAMMSVLIGLAFVVLVVSGGILFLSPPGRVANWSGWRMLGYTKHEWSDLHIWFAVVFIIAAVLHTVFNIRLLLSYFRSRLTRRIGFRWEWVVALAVAGAVFAGTRAGVPPFSSFLAFNERIKQSWEDPRAVAPMPHAELLTVQDLAAKAGVPLETATERLTRSGLQGVDPAVVVAELAAQNSISAQRLFEILCDVPSPNAHPGQHRSAGASGGKGATSGQGGRGGGWGGGGGGGGGAGRMTLGEYCVSRGIELETALARLQAHGIEASADQTLREVASAYGYSRPMEIVGLVEGDGERAGDH